MTNENLTLSPDMQNVENSIMTERSPANYQKYLEITEDEIMRCSTILEIGSGTEQEFAKFVKAVSPNTKVISVDPRLALPLEVDLSGMFPEEYESRIQGRTNPEPNSLAAIAQYLPLKSSSVDLIVASRSVPLYIYDQESMDKVVKEIERVLSSGGNARIYPISEGIKMEMFLKSLENTSLEISANRIKEEMGSTENHFFLLTKK